MDGVSNDLAGGRGLLLLRPLLLLLLLKPGCLRLHCQLLLLLLLHLTPSQRAHTKRQSQRCQHRQEVERRGGVEGEDEYEEE